MTVGPVSISNTSGINAGGKQITNVASGAGADNNAANIGDVKSAVANLSQTLTFNNGDATKDSTVDLKTQKLSIAGADGVTTTVNGQTLTVGLDANTVNATTKGIGLTGDNSTSTGNKYLKDGDVSFAVTGDNTFITSTASTTGIALAVSESAVKAAAVSAVTVSTSTGTDNPIKVTPTAGTNSKDYAISIDTSKLAEQTSLTYHSNSTGTNAATKTVSLSKGLDFTNGTSTVATIGNDGVVTFDLNTDTKNQIDNCSTAVGRKIFLGSDNGSTEEKSLSTGDVKFNVKGATGSYITTSATGDTVTLNTTKGTIASTNGTASVTGSDGLATAKNVADAINAAKSASAWKVAANDTSNATTVNGGDTVTFKDGNNIKITQDGKNITVSTADDITVNSVTAKNSVTTGTGDNKITLDGTTGTATIGEGTNTVTITGTTGAVTAKIVTADTFTAGNSTMNTNGFTNGDTTVNNTGIASGTGDIMRFPLQLAVLVQVTKLLRM